MSDEKKNELTEEELKEATGGLSASGATPTSAGVRQKGVIIDYPSGGPQPGDATPGSSGVADRQEDDEPDAGSGRIGAR